MAVLLLLLPNTTTGRCRSIRSSIIIIEPANRIRIRIRIRLYDDDDDDDDEDEEENGKGIIISRSCSWVLQRVVCVVVYRYFPFGSIPTTSRPLPEKKKSRLFSQFKMPNRRPWDIVPSANTKKTQKRGGATVGQKKTG
jgi:hypothetical protein